MYTKALLTLGVMATAFLAAVNGQSDGAAEPNDKIHTVYITKVTFVSGPSPTGPTSPSPFAIETAIVRETIWSNPTSSTWTTLGVGTEYPPTLSTSTVYTTTQLVAVSVKWTTVNVNRRSPGVANGSVALNATDLSPSSSSPPPEESWPSPIISAPESSTMTMLWPLHSGATEPPPLLPTNATSDTAPAIILSSSEAPPPSEASTSTTSSSPAPVETPAPPPQNVSCIERWCSDNGSSYCMYWGGVTAENSAGEPIPGMVLTHLGDCTLVATTLSNGAVTTVVSSPLDAPPTNPDATSYAYPGLTSAPFSGVNPSSIPAPDVTEAPSSAAMRRRGRGRIYLV